jgi:hypothetical protein
MKSNRLIIWLALALVALAFPGVALAQDEYRLNVNKTFGYNAGNEIRGTFSLTVTGDETAIQRVVFLLDGQPFAEAQQPPWSTTLVTSDHPDGIHALSAMVTTTGGRSMTTAGRNFNFVSAEGETQGMVRVVVPILALVLGVTVLGFVIQFAVSGGKKAPAPAAGTRRNYGMAGGAICRHCKRPTPRHVWGMNLVVGKLDRCENCGKWSLMMRAPESVLRAAEEAELADAKAGAAPIAEKSEEERLKEMLDNSRFSNHL